jgi:hypothetical protein
MPGETGVTVVTMLVCFLLFTHEAAGASSARHSLRPLIFRERDVDSKIIRPRDREVVFEIAATSLRGAKRRSNPAFLFRAANSGLLRFARNDVLKTPCVLAV